MVQITSSKAAHLATVAAAIVTAVSLALGYWQFNRTLELQREASAIALFMDYLKLTRELEVAETKNSDVFKSDAVMNTLVTTAETIYKLRHNNRHWKRTAESIVGDNAEEIAKGVWECDTFDDQFLLLVKEKVPTLQCDTSIDVAKK